MFVFTVTLALLPLHVVLPNVIAPCSSPDFTFFVVACAVPVPVFPALSPAISTFMSYVVSCVRSVNIWLEVLLLDFSSYVLSVYFFM